MVQHYAADQLIGVTGQLFERAGLDAVFVQVLDPETFGGLAAFRRQTQWLAEVARNSPPVRVPGDGAMARKRAALADGVELYPGILEVLGAWAAKLGVATPAPI